MIFRETPVPGAFVIEPEPREDERGFFARAFCRREFEEHGLVPDFVQCNLSFNVRAGTLRGMHFQRSPHQEVKLVRCIRGSIYDVLVDLRPDSSTFRQWFGAELTAENRSMLYVPEGCAHGFQTLVDGSEVFYQVSEFYAPGSEGGVRWDDPAFGIEWPRVSNRVLSEKDRSWPSFEG